MSTNAPTRPVTVRYAEPDYWEARYQREPALFEWFFGHTALRRILRTYISKKKPILHVGCGTSNLQEGMARSGYTIINTDISEVVIKQMTVRHGQYSNMTYRVSDCRKMPEFMDCSFGHVLDKGTMDALLCCKQGTENVMLMLLEIYRVLQPGGSFLLVTLGDPTRRLPLLCDARLPWKVSLLLLPKIQAANQAYVDGKPINDSTEPVEAQGPFEVIDADTILDLPSGLQYTNFFFAYVCKKQPLQLPQYHGQKAAVPNGWVAGSKELFQKLQKELGLPEDLLAKGRRKRVMHVPAGQASASMHVLPHPSNVSSAASAASGTSSPLSLAALQSACSNSSLPTPPLQELQSALTALQLEGEQAGASEASPAARDRQDLPARPASAPNLVSILESEAALVEQGMLPAMIDGQPCAVGVPEAAAVAPAAGMAPGFHSPCSPAVGDVDTHAAATGLQGQQLLAPTAVLVPQLSDSSSAVSPAAGSSDTELLVHFVSSPGNLQPTATAVDSIGEQPQTPAVIQVLNFAAPAARYVETAGSSGAAAPAAASAEEGVEEGAAAGGAVLEPSPRPPLGPPLVTVSSTPNSPAAGSPSHVSNRGGGGGQQPPLWIGTRLQAGQVLPQLAGQQQQQAMAAAATAGMFPHSVAPHTLRAPRLRRFSTEYGALSGSALQMQLEQLRLLQAQHSESAADGLVLHDVAAADSCGSGAAAAAAVAAAAWGGCVRPPRDRRLSNISVLSGLSVMSSVSIDESGEEVLDGQGSAVNTVACSSEPSCQLLLSGPAQAESAAPVGATVGNDATPSPCKGPPHLLSPDGQHTQS